MKFSLLPKIVGSLILTLFAGSALGQVNIGLSGYGSRSNAGLETYRSASGSVSLSFGVGDHVLLGLTHRQSFENKEGLKKASSSDGADVYLPFSDDTESTTNSFDLTLILYNGQVSPFIFGGVAKKDYRTEIDIEGRHVVSSVTLFPVPTYGFGFGIMLSREFNLKISQTYSPGVQTVIEGGEEKSQMVRDTYTQVGISYKIN